VAVAQGSAFFLPQHPIPTNRPSIQPIPVLSLTRLFSPLCRSAKGNPSLSPALEYYGGIVFLRSGIPVWRACPDIAEASGFEQLPELVLLVKP
jgi:hypothetical protein